MEVYLDEFGDSKYRPCPLREYVAAGRLGHWNNTASTATPERVARRLQEPFGPSLSKEACPGPTDGSADIHAVDVHAVS